jgi:hypothetical protein
MIMILTVLGDAFASVNIVKLASFVEMLMW